ncbi:hypothetical protein ROHU_011671 [Labeo rohita]|uniref:Uncharacterized protein n=1 Tax=Labeo rohita TaxID=84645 RepID=A0A498LRJ8_LABRO|nr:hypothetical protein ROHU_011671 [Labeo rohita]
MNGRAQNSHKGGETALNVKEHPPQRDSPGGRPMKDGLAAARHETNDYEGAARGACSMWQNPPGTSRQLDFPRHSLSTLGPPPATPPDLGPHPQ